MTVPFYNRRITPSDFLNQTIEVRDERREVPASDILSEPLYCLKFNEEWKSHIIGAVATLRTYAAWIGEDDDTNTGTRQITKLLAQDMTNCGDPCDIEVLLSDDTFFYDEYLQQIFGDKYTNTETRKTERDTAYDGTPQSIGSIIPTGTPNDREKNALCGALNRFVALYSSEKICMLQSRNFLEIAYQNVEDAAESFYDSTLDQMLGNWSDNLFGCIVDVPTALIALADASAQETLACYLFDQLDGVTITESAFNTAIDNAALSLSGNAQKIACVMSEDYAQSVYLAFLEGYNVALLQQNAGENVDCPCSTATYQLWTWDFRTQGQGESKLDVANNLQLGTFVAGQGWQAVNRLTGRSLAFVLRVDPSWKIRSFAAVQGGTGTVNTRQMQTRTVANLASSSSGALIMTGGTGEYTHCRGAILAPAVTGVEQVVFSFAIPNQTTTLIIHKIAILYDYGFAAPSAIPTNDGNLCD